MTLLQQIERMRYMHYLISRGKTGTPDCFAGKLQLSRRQVFNILDEIRTLGVEIKYDKQRETYYYSGEKFLHVDYSFREISQLDSEKIYGGKIFLPECYEIARCTAIFVSVI